MNAPAANAALSQSITEMFKSVEKAAPAEVDISLIDVSDQIRKEFEDAQNTLDGLAESIGSLGVLLPVLLRPQPGGRYLLVAGERRLRAAKLAGLTTIPCRVRKLDDREALASQLTENIHRKNLTPMEAAKALKQLLEDYDGDRAKVATRIGKNPTWITQHLNLLDLPPQAKRLYDEGLSADPTILNNFRQIEKSDPGAAKALVDQATAKPGSIDLRRASDAVKKEAKARTSPGKAAAPGKSSGPAPSTATPRDRSMEEPGPATSTGGAGMIFPSAPLKPHEKAINAFVDAARKSGSDAGTIVGSVSASDREAIAKHGATFFDRGAKADDLASALIAGLARNEFGKGPVELFNLAAFLQGHGKAEKFEVDTALAKIIPAK